MDSTLHFAALRRPSLNIVQAFAKGKFENHSVCSAAVAHRVYAEVSSQVKTYREGWTCSPKAANAYSNQEDSVISYEDLKQACSAGGASVLTSVTELGAAAGPHASVAPAKFVDRSASVFAFETRYIDGEPTQVALLDSKQSQLNRGEDAITQDIHAGHPVMSRIPRIEVGYGDGRVLTDLDLPHRFADGHVRAGEIDGVPATQHESYRAVRNSSPADASALLNTAPSALVFGGWDSTRRSNQLRLRSALVGEIIGVLADQSLPGTQQQSRRGGARVDSLAMSVQLAPADLGKLVDTQEEELSPKLVQKLRDEIKKAKKGTTLSGSNLGLGGIPPALESLGGVSCSRIIRSWVLSFATLRQLRFGGGPEADVAARALLAAFALATVARSERELYLRANCDLVETAAPVVTLDQRHGNQRQLDPLTVEAADALLTEAMEEAERLGVAQWHGQVLRVTGNPIVLGGAVDADDEED